MNPDSKTELLTFYARRSGYGALAHRKGVRRVGDNPWARRVHLVPQAERLWKRWPQFFADVNFVSSIIASKKGRPYFDLLELEREVISSLSSVPEMRAPLKHRLEGMALTALSLREADYELTVHLAREIEFYHAAIVDFVERYGTIAESDIRQVDTSNAAAQSEVDDLLSGGKTIKDSLERLLKKIRKYHIPLPYDRIENWFSVLNEILSLLRGGS